MECVLILLLCHSQEKLSKLKQIETRLEKEKRQLMDSLENATTRSTRLEVTKRALEGDVQRLQKVLSERESENQVSCVFRCVRNGFLLKCLHMIVGKTFSPSFTTIALS